MYRATSIRLLTGADIHITYDRQVKKYIATATVGFSSETAIADDPVTAIGLAVIVQAGMTESKLKEKLEAGPEEGQGDESGWGK